ncbi:M56 family metallopeptidase [Symmachiella dynata]|nr:M56 family metallopeptidase [Symmachiella dynata]
MWWLTQHLIIAAALTVVVFAITRWRRIRPSVAHALWLLVLIKLLVPPLVVWPWTPLPAAAVEAPIYEMPATTTGVEITSLEVPDNFLELAPPPVATTAAPISFTTAALAVWLTGAVLVVCWRSLQGFRLWRMVRCGSPAPVGLQQEAADAAVRSGIAPLRIRLVPGLAAPGIWCTVRPILLWPRGLAPALSPQGLRSVLLHELAHVRRKDHLTAWLVLLGEIIWWWNPCFWITRRLLHENAELACDAWVTTVLPESRRDYAEALLAFASPRSQYFTPQPALGLHSTLKKTFTRRLTMIMEETRHPRHMSRWGICAIVLFGLAVLPAWSRGEDEQAKPIVETPVANEPSSIPESEQNTASEAEPPAIYIDRHGEITPSLIGDDYIELLKQPNAEKPTQALHVFVDLGTENNVVVKAIKDLRDLGFTREQLIVRRIRGGQPQLNSFFTTRTYAVGHIVVPSDTRSIMERAKAIGHKNPNMFLKQDEIVKGLNSLNELIKSTVSPDTWHRVGGPGSISVDNTNLSLVIHQTNGVHDEIGELLDQLKSLQLKSAEAYVAYLRDVPDSVEIPNESVSSPPKPRVNSQEPQLIAVSYMVEDLLYDYEPVSLKGLSIDEHRRRIKKSLTSDDSKIEPEFPTLIKIIKTVLGSEKWIDAGGRGTMGEFRTTLSLVVRQTEQEHKALADLLDAMRKANLGRAIADGDKQAIREFTENYQAKNK